MRQDTQVETIIKYDRFLDELNWYDLRNILPNNLDLLSNNGFYCIHVIRSNFIPLLNCK